MKEYGLFDKLKFGKYKGDAIVTVLQNDPMYIKRAANNIDWFCVTPEVEDQLLERTVGNEK